MKDMDDVLREILKDKIFFTLMESAMPDLDMKKTQEYADRIANLIKSSEDPEFFDKEYFDALGGAVSSQQQIAILNNISAHLSSKALRMTFYIYIKQQWLITKKSIEINLENKLNDINIQDIQRADKIVDQFVRILDESSSEHLAKKNKEGEQQHNVPEHQN